MNLYMMQELLGVMLVLAVLVGIILVFGITFILFQEVIRRALVWTKSVTVHLQGSRREIRAPPVGSEKDMPSLLILPSIANPA